MEDGQGWSLDRTSAACPSSRGGGLHTPAGRAPPVSPFQKRLPLRIPSAGAQESVAAAGTSTSANHRCAGLRECVWGAAPLPALDSLSFLSSGLAATILSSSPTPVLSLFQLSAAGDVFHQRLHLREDPRPPSDPGPNCHAPTASWSPQATACCRRWLKALLEVPLAPPVWAAPTFSHRRLLSFKEQQKVEGKVPEVLRAAMAQGRLLQQRDLGSLPTAEPPPGPEPGPKDELSERLEAAWEGPMAAWWEQQQDRTSGPGRQPKRHKRRMQLSNTFSSLSGHLDLSGATSPPHSPDWTSPVSRPRSPVTLPSQELPQDLWAQGIPSERQQTLRDYMAKLPLQGNTPESASASLSQTSSTRATPSRQRTLRDCTAELPPHRDTPEGATAPSSQTSSIWATPSRQQVRILSGSQPHRKKPRMGF